MNTIIALATNLENSSIVVVRVSGEKSILFLEELTRSTYKRRGLFVRKAFIEGKFIDEVVLNVYKKPYSFTGENVVEIMAHANKIIIDELITFFIKKGCCLAKRGEFLERAFLNKKITFEKAQLINEIIKINNKNVLDLYREKYNKKNKSLTLTRIRNLIEEIIMNNDMAIEYPEYEKEKKLDENLKRIKIIKKLIKVQLNKIELITQLEKGIQVAIIGKPNVGKSSLFNALLNKDRSIITKIPGTTTDYIEDSIYLKNGIKVSLIDTAGLRKTKKIIEKIGISKARDVLKKVEITLWLENNEKNFENLPFQSNAHIVKVVSKADLLTKKERNKEYFYTSIYEKTSINKLLKELNNLTSNKIKELKKGEIVLISNKGSLLEIITHLDVINKGLKKGFTIDIFRSSLEKCLLLANSLLGEKGSYDYIERIFRTFCIGK